MLLVSRLRDLDQAICVHQHVKHVVDCSPGRTTRQGQPERLVDRTTLNDLSYETSGGEKARMPSRRAASRRQRSTSRPSSLMPRSIRFCAPASFPIKEGARTRSAVNATCSSIRTGVVIAHQTFGDMLRWNPHFHAIVLEGGFDEQGTFVYIPLGHLQAMTELLRRRVVALLVDQTCTSSTLWDFLAELGDCLRQLYSTSHRRGCNSFVVMACTPRGSRVTGPACPTFCSGRHQVGRAKMTTRPPPHPTGPRAQRCLQRKPTLQTRVNVGMRGPACSLESTKSTHLSAPAAELG